MGRMNTGRILLGGLLAGVIINVSEFLLWGLVMADEMAANMEMYGLTEAGWAMWGYILAAFVLGIMIIWFYAAMRPRFGPGPRTAVIAGAAVWVVSGLIPYVWMAAMGLGYSAGLTVLALAWGLVEYILAGAAGGWLYQEDQVAAAEPAAAAPPPPPPPPTSEGPPSEGPPSEGPSESEGPSQGPPPTM
jgi:hypothetical protein